MVATTAPPRSARSTRDIVLSLAALLIPIAIMVGVYKYFFTGEAPVRVDASQTYATARHDAGYPILEPSGLPSGWTTTGSTFDKVSDGSVLRVAYVAPSRTGLQLVESNRPVNSLLPDELGTNAQPGDLVTLGGQQWRSYPVARDGNRALVLAENGHTTVVIGIVSDADLRTFALALH
jgi:hypothetical protein